MAKISNNDIPSINEDWGLDPKNNLPYSGRAVQKFIKDTLNSKVADFYFDNDTAKIYNFKSIKDKEEWLETRNPDLVLSEVPFSGKVNKIEITNKTPGKPGNNVYFTTNSETAELIIGLKSLEKGITDSEYQELNEDFFITVEVDKGNTGLYESIIDNRYVSNGKDFSVNVKDYLIIGENRVKFTVTGNNTKVVNSFIITTNLTSLYLKPSKFDWTTPFIEGVPYILGGLEIGGNLYKEVVVKVTKEGYETIYRDKTIGTQTFISSAYNFRDMEFPEPGTGVYNVEIWLDANGVESEHLNYNIICVSAVDQFTAKLVAVNTLPSKIINGTENKLFEYCLYNGGKAIASPSIKSSYVINTNPTTIIEEVLENTETEVVKSYSYLIEIDSEEASIYLDSIITFGNEQQVITSVDNSKNYPATKNAVFYMNASTRSNEQGNKDKIINQVTGEEINTQFNNVIWVNGADGWTTDANDRKCLKLLANSTANISYQPLANVNTKEGKTIELVYKVSNVSDYNDPIISICNDPQASDFKGLKITPKNILAHSTNLTKEDKLQDYNLEDESIIHVIFTIIYDYRTNYGNMAQIYVNGTKCRSFEFSALSDTWETASNIILGNTTSDLYVYKIRVYDRSFGKEDATRNYLNSLASLEERDLVNEYLNSPVDDSYNINYEQCVKNGLNTMVIEMLGKNTNIPSLSNPTSGQCNLIIDIKNIVPGELDDEMESLLTGTFIKNQTIEGQGTTAMTYGRWNFRWKLGSKYNKRRITAKKNFASSMHSHKMGATRLFNYLHEEVVGSNDVNGKVAVLQYPVYGFQKVLLESGKYEYRFIGLYTVGADKGDKHTFGFDDPRYKDTLMHLEGTDHTPKAVGFDYPWGNTKFDASVEGMGAVDSEGNVIAAWEVGAAGNYSADDPSDTTAIQNMLNTEFKPAYDVIYNNSPMIIGVVETLEQINSNVEDWLTKISSSGKEYSNYEFYTHGVYDLYYYNIGTKKFEPSGINIQRDLGIENSELEGKSLEEINALFINKRQQRFTESWGNYWDIEDTIFHYCFVQVFGATDNFKKNTYPYKFIPLNDIYGKDGNLIMKGGGKWRWRSDDLDTIFDINNQGLAAKNYSILVGDTTISGSVYRGDTSVLWTLIKNTQQTKIRSTVHSIFNAMVAKATSLNLGSNTIDKLIGCIRYYFWTFAQEYFPPSAYNSDSEWAYEDIWIQPNLWKEVNPLSQSLGSHYEAEKDWVKMRMLFLASYYNYGPFTNVKDGFSDTTTGQIAYGGAGSFTFNITPAIDFNPTIIRGQTEYVSSGTRVSAGDTASIYLSSSSGADTRVYIQGVDWISSIGDLSTLTVTEDNPKLNIASKRLQSLIIGNENPDLVTSNVGNLEFGECPSLVSIDARNLKDLSGDLKLSGLTRLRTALFGGTKITSVELPTGSRIQHLQVPNTITSIYLKENNFLTSFEYETLENLTTLNIQYCDVIDGWEMLKSAYNNGVTNLRNIKVLGINYEGTAEDLIILSELATKVDDNGNRKFVGIGTDEKPDNTLLPVLEGTISVDYAYQDNIDTIERYYSGKLQVVVRKEVYIKFNDPEFQKLIAKIPAEGGYGDGYGVTREQLDKVTYFPNNFMLGNVDIVDLSDLDKFKNLSIMDVACFSGCKSLKYLTLGSTKNRISLQQSCFASISYLEKLVCKCPITTNAYCFKNTQINEIHFNNIEDFLNTYGKYELGRGDGIICGYKGDIFINNEPLPNKIVVPESCTVIESITGCNNITELILHDNITDLSVDGTSITSLRVPSLITKISNQRNTCKISGATKLTDLELNNVNVITTNQGSSSIKNIWIRSLITWINNINGKGYIMGGKPIIYIGSLGDKSNPITTEMVNKALKNITEIKQYTFYNMTQLEGKLVIPSTITSLLQSCFEASGITEVEIEEGVTSVGNMMFHSCPKLEIAKLPSTITNMGINCFWATEKMKTLIIKAVEPPTYNTNALYERLTAIYVPYESVKAYQTTTNWINKAGIIRPFYEVEELPTTAENGDLYIIGDTYNKAVVTDGVLTWETI